MVMKMLRMMRAKRTGQFIVNLNAVSHVVVIIRLVTVAIMTPETNPIIMDAMMLVEASS
jgi:hypothetical protein